VTGRMERKIPVTASLTPRQVGAIEARAKRLSLSFNDALRRIIDATLDGEEAARAPERILVLDRTSNELRRAR
jgi:hypothetical protein